MDKKLKLATGIVLVVWGLGVTFCAAAIYYDGDDTLFVFGALAFWTGMFAGIPVFSEWDRIRRDRRAYRKFNELLEAEFTEASDTNPTTLTFEKLQASLKALELPPESGYFVCTRCLRRLHYHIVTGELYVRTVDSFGNPVVVAHKDECCGKEAYKISSPSQVIRLPRILGKERLYGG